MNRKNIIVTIVLLLSICNALGNVFYPRDISILMGILMALAGIANYMYQRQTETLHRILQSHTEVTDDFHAKTDKEMS